MLGFLRGKVSERKLRLFAVACCRRIAHLAGLPTVTLAEHAAEGLVSENELAEAHAESALTYEQVVGPFTYVPPPASFLAEAAALAALAASAFEAATAASAEAVNFAGDGEAEIQAALLRDLFNPFCPLDLHPSWLTATVLGLAQAAYQERDLPSGQLASDRLAVLADALEDFGCTDPVILGHLRGMGPHILGCFVLDRLLGRE
jgi:hypothetical protein